MFTNQPYSFYYPGGLGIDVGIIVCSNGSTPRSCWQFPSPQVVILGYFILAVIVVLLFDKRKRDKKVIKNWISGLLNIIIPGFSQFYSNNLDRGVRIFANVASLILLRQIVILIIDLLGGNPTILASLYLIVLGFVLFITGNNTTTKFYKGQIANPQ